MSLSVSDGRKKKYIESYQAYNPTLPQKQTHRNEEQPASTPYKQTAEWASSWPSQIPCFINKLHYLCLDNFHYRGYLQGYQDPSDLIRSQRDTADNCFLTGLCPQLMHLLRVWFFADKSKQKHMQGLTTVESGVVWGRGRGGGDTDLKQGSPFLSLSLENFFLPH